MSTKLGKLGVTVPLKAKELGELCNNPLNLMGAKDNWRGKAGMYSNDAGGYVVFKETDNIPGWVWGFRAAFVDWNTKLKADKDGKLTVPELIHQWAPSNVHNNNTKGYIDRVLTEAHMTKDEGIDLKDRDQCIRVAQAMCIVENRRTIYSDEDVGWGWDLAHGVKAKKVLSPVAKGVITAGAAAGTERIVNSDVAAPVIDAIASNVPVLQSAGNIDGWIGIVLGVLAVGGIVYALYRVWKAQKEEK